MKESEKQSNINQQALDYHSNGRPGKIEVVSTKPCQTAKELSLAYSPGVAIPCMEIAKNPEDAFKYTGKGNLVGVISNGTAVLGLGNIGALAGKPVMEGKGVLFKRFADIDVFDIEINDETIDGMVETIAKLEPTFGGINLEDIKAPECFEIEAQLKEKMNIPVFHDDQHGTAIISAAGFINAIELTKRKVEETIVVFSGAGAAAISCARLFKRMGVLPENLYMCDSKGVIYQGRKEGMNQYKDEFANKTDYRTLADAMKGADCFIGCSAKGVLTQDMVKTMASDPIIFAMANPDPEITPEEVAEVRDDAIMATGRSDYPNQVNNVLGFPFIFRGALDVRASKINEEMKLAAVHALADLAKEEVPDEVKKAYGNQHFQFGREYLIPKPFDKRVLTRVSPAVAKAAMDTKVAKTPIKDLNQYKMELEARMGNSGAFIQGLRNRLSKKKKTKIVYPEGVNSRILQAVNIIRDENYIEPVLLGNAEEIHAKMDKLKLSHLKKLEIIDPVDDPNFEKLAAEYFNLRQRKGVTQYQARDLMLIPNYFGSMLVKQGIVDGLVTGATQNYPECIRPLMQIVGPKEKHKAAGISILVFKQKVIFLADCTMQIEPNSQDLADIAMNSANIYRKLMLKEPRVAFLSFSNFGSNEHDSAVNVRKAVKITRELDPNLIVDGEIQADVAVNDDLRDNLFSFSALDKDADILIFPNLDSANISYKLLSQLADATTLGPILTPMNEPVHIVQRTSSVSEIVNMSIINALVAQKKDRK